MAVGNGIGIGVPMVGLGGGGAVTEPKFIIQVKTDESGTSADNQFTLPWIGTYDVIWGDGTSDSGVTDTQTHTYATAGTYDVSVTATTGRIRFNNGGDKSKLLDIKNWGICKWSSMSTAFNGCDNLIELSAIDTPDLSSVTDMRSMFNRAKNLNTIPNVNSWDVSNVTSISFTFGASKFNQDIGNWDTSNVTNMSGVFWGNNQFNYNIGNWNTSNVTTVYKMFDNNKINHSLAGWDISNITDFGGFMTNNTNFSTENYNATLISWALQSPQSNIVIGFRSKYSYEASAARQTLIDTHGWTIIDGGQVAVPEFVIHVKTDEDGVSNANQFELPWVGTYSVDWGDSTVETGVVDTQTHTYATAGTYYIKVVATSGKVRFNNTGDKLKLLYIANWGNCEWTDMEYAFDGCSNLDMLAQDIPNFNSVTTTKAMFRNCAVLIANPSIANWNMTNVTKLGNGYHNGMFTYCRKFNQPIGSWDVSNVTDMHSLFVSNNVFNQPLNNWDVSSVTDMQLMFRDCKVFNQPLNNWNVSNLDKMAGTFKGARLFNQDIGGWNVSNVTKFADGFSGPFQDADAFNNGGSDSIKNWNVSNTNGEFGGRYGGGFFRNAKAFNQPIGNWDVSNVTDMSNVFIFTDSFNQPLNNWNVSNVTKMDNTFRDAAAFDQSLANWDIRQVTGFKDFMKDVSSFSVSNYDATLISWAAQTLNSNISIDFGTSRYTLGGPAEAARNTLINTYGWTITDGGTFNTPISGLLFDYPNAERAYSLRQLAGYAGGLEIPVVRVRRSNDNVEQDFKAAEISNGTLTTFTGTNDGLVVKVYDQGNVYHITQTTADRQAKIVNAGSLLLENGKPTMTTIAGYSYASNDNSLDYYTNTDTFTYTIHKLDGSLTSNTDVFVDSAGNAGSGRMGFSLASSYARINYNGTISSISYARELIDDILQPLVWESYPSDTTLNNRLKVYNQNGLLADGNTSNTTPTGQGSYRNATFFGAESGTYLAPEGNWQESVLYKKGNIPNRDNFLTSINDYYNFPPTSGLLYNYPGASVAYSLRNLANNVTNVVRVRRSTDNAEQDFSSTQITDGTLTTFTGANDGFVTTWYDQSGNGRNAVQATALRQPKLVSSGVLQTKNSKPTLIFNKVNSSSLFGNEILRLDSPNDFCSFGVGALNDNNDIGVLFSNTSSSFRRIVSFVSSTLNMIVSQDTSVLNNIALENNLNLITSYRSGNIINGQTNGTELNSVAAENNYGNDRLSIGIQFSNNTAIDGCISEIIIYPTDQNSNITKIETNINQEYDIYESKGLLAEYPGASAAYSLRSLIDTIDNVVKVRRSSDNAEQDFTATQITDGTLTAFTGSNDGYVTTWYDQSGNNNNATQPTASEQPKLVSSGVVELDNGKPCLNYDTSGYDNFSLATTLTDVRSVFQVWNAEFNSGSFNQFILGRNNGYDYHSGDNNKILSSSYSAGYVRNGNNYINSALTDFGNTTRPLAQSLISMIHTQSSGQVNQLTKDRGNNRSWQGKMQEIILYSTDQTSNKAGIETNINNEYTIY